MRLTCPNCDAQYEIDDALVPAGGRDVECSACGQVWFQGAAAPKPVEPSPLSRKLSPSVLSILREEAARELEARELEGRASDGQRPPPEATEPQFSPEDELEPIGDEPPLPLEAAPESERSYYDVHITDWPATTVTADHTASLLKDGEAGDTPPAGGTDGADSVDGDQREAADDLSEFDLSPDFSPQPKPEPQPRPESATIPPLTLPDAELLAATLSPVFTVQTAEFSSPIFPQQTPKVTVESAPMEPSPKRSGETLPVPTPRNQLPATIVVKPPKPPEPGYPWGFALALAAAVVIAGLYVAAPRLADQGAFGATLMELRTEADKGRVWLADKADQIVQRIRSE